MRFTQRKKHIQWQPDTVTSEAVATLNEALEADALPVITLKLARGQGIICNNVLHSRSKFSDTDDQEIKRCLHRIRYAERVRPGELEL